MSIRFLIAVVLMLSVASVFGQSGAQKKNRRPTGDQVKTETEKPKAGPPVYFYEFTKPEFVVSKVHIEHDENGIGLIRFEKKALEEEFTRPLILSSATTKFLKDHWSNLGFLSSTENYQSERKYPHLGLMKLRMANDDGERSVDFNWTDNPDTKALTEEYKKIGYQHVWMFDIEVARKNQPLESPRIMKELDSYLRRGRISDPGHMIPYLMALSVDERMPLIARNHAKRLAESITKKKD